jgi:hypothetical protein
MYLRSFKKGGKRYYYLAKAVRTGSKVIQKYVLYIGTADTLFKKLKELKSKTSGS